MIDPVLPEILCAKARVYLELQECMALLQKLALRHAPASEGRHAAEADASRGRATERA